MRRLFLFCCGLLLAACSAPNPIQTPRGQPSTPGSSPRQASSEWSDRPPATAVFWLYARWDDPGAREQLLRGWHRQLARASIRPLSKQVPCRLEQLVALSSEGFLAVLPSRQKANFVLSLHLHSASEGEGYLQQFTRLREDAEAPGHPGVRISRSWSGLAWALRGNSLFMAPNPEAVSEALQAAAVRATHSDPVAHAARTLQRVRTPGSSGFSAALLLSEVPRVPALVQFAEPLLDCSPPEEGAVRNVCVELTSEGWQARSFATLESHTEAVRVSTATFTELARCVPDEWGFVQLYQPRVAASALNQAAAGADPNVDLVAWSVAAQPTSSDLPQVPNQLLVHFLSSAAAEHALQKMRDADANSTARPVAILLDDGRTLACSYGPRAEDSFRQMQAARARRQSSASDDPIWAGVLDQPLLVEAHRWDTAVNPTPGNNSALAPAMALGSRWLPPRGSGLRVGSVTLDGQVLYRTEVSHGALVTPSPGEAAATPVALDQPDPLPPPPQVQDARSTCLRNQQDLRLAVEMFIAENNQPPASLQLLVPDYLKSIRACPASGRDSYSASYHVNEQDGSYGFHCTDPAHSDLPPVTRSKR